MSSFKWIATSLKNLRITGTGTGNPVVQARLASSLQQTDANLDIPAKPKRPMGPFMRFLSENKPKLTQQNPQMKPTELSRLLGEKWHEMEQKTKEDYSKTFQNEMGDYKVAIEKYNKSLSPEQKKVILQQQLEKNLRKEKREKKQRLKELGKPKKPATSFIRFLMANVPKGTAPEVFQSECKVQAAKWKTMSVEEKAPFTAAFQKEARAYKKELAMWEKRMLETGNDDVIRKRTPTKTSSGKSKSAQDSEI